MAALITIGTDVSGSTLAAEKRRAGRGAVGMSEAHGREEIMSRLLTCCGRMAHWTAHEDKLVLRGIRLREVRCPLSV